MPRIILIISSKFYRASKSSVEIPGTASLIGRTISLIALIENEKNNLTNKLATIRAADPLTSLKRGFSLVYRKDGGLLKSVEEISTGEQIQVTVSDGIIFSTVNHTIGK